jgi:hypothetical protein
MTEKRNITISLRDPEIQKKIDGRATVLLDTNIWIDLAEAKTAQTSRLQDKLRELVGSSKLFCPLSASMIWELYRQTYSSALRVATLMEELSLNIAFAPSEEIFVSEVQAALEEVWSGASAELGAVALFVPFFAHISSLAELQFPESFRFGDPQKFAEFVRRECRAIGVVELCTMMQDRLPIAEVQAPAYAAAATRRKEFARGDKEKARRIEEDAILRSTVIPLLKSLYVALPPQKRITVARSLAGISEETNDSAARNLLKSMPAITHFIDVQTAVGQDPGRKDKTRDFHDREVMMTPFVYSDVFVSRDRGIRHILSCELKEGISSKKRCIWTYNALEEYLDHVGPKVPAGAQAPGEYSG